MGEAGIVRAARRGIAARSCPAYAKLQIVTRGFMAKINIHFGKLNGKAPASVARPPNAKLPREPANLNMRLRATAKKLPLVSQERKIARFFFFFSFFFFLFSSFSSFVSLEERNTKESYGTRYSLSEGCRKVIRIVSYPVSCSRLATHRGEIGGTLFPFAILYGNATRKKVHRRSTAFVLPRLPCPRSRKRFFRRNKSDDIQRSNSWRSIYNIFAFSPSRLLGGIARGSEYRSGDRDLIPVRFRDRYYASEATPKPIQYRNRLLPEYR